MREYLTRSELLAALQSGEHLEAHPRTPYAGEPVEYQPRTDPTNNHPDFYPWHVVGRPNYDRLCNTEVVAAEAA
ncbi:hypothetical protein [Streptomyces sp. YIM S03343]